MSETRIAPVWWRQVESALAFRVAADADARTFARPPWATAAEAEARHVREIRRFGIR